MQEKDEEFISLKSLMTEENETVHQIEVEMQKLLQIISDDKQLIQEKDLLIRKLRKQTLEIDQMNFKEKYLLYCHVLKHPLYLNILELNIEGVN